MLAATVAVIMGSVVGLRALIAPDQPTFADAVAAAGEGDEPFLPEAPGGELRVTGDREGSFSLGGEAGPPGYGLRGDDGRMHFDGSGEGLELIQFSYDGLEFFPKEDDCTVVPGQVDSRRGIAAAEVDCPEIRDVRDIATITLKGRVGLPAAMVGLDLPDVGGTLTAGDETWEVLHGHFVVIEAANVTSDGPSMSMSGFEFSLEFSREEGAYSLDRVHYQGTANDVPPTVCSVQSEELGALSPNTVRLQVGIGCAPVQIEGLGEVPIEGSAVVDQLTLEGP